MFFRALSNAIQYSHSPCLVHGNINRSRALFFVAWSQIVFRKLVAIGLTASLFANGMASAQTVRSEAMILADAKSFMASYAEDLLGGKKDVIIGRYDARGSYRLGEGRKTFLSADELKKHYMERWRAPIAMAWRELSYEVLGTDAVLVMGLLDWESSPENKTTFSYTGLLSYQDGVLRIRLEDESRRIPPPAVIKPETGASK